jgi:predicted ATPase
MLRKFESDDRRPSIQMANLLAEIFSIPSSERTTFLKFARGDWQSAPGQFIEDALWHNTAAHRSNIPAPATSLVGREQELIGVCEYLLKADIRLVTLIGPPGIGKTRLSLEAARETAPNFLNGVYFVALAPLDDPTLIAPAIVQSLGYAETKKHSALEQLINSIGDKQMLLVLDNLEHLMEGAAPLVSDLLSACPRLKMLVTSREALRVSGEWIYSVPALRIPREGSSINMETASNYPALTLFTERARAVRSDFVLNAGNIQAVASICAQLDGLPLGIELLAARIRLMSPQALLERLNDQFVLSADGMRAVAARQKTLQNAIAWSYNLLSIDDQKIFASLSVFAGGFTLETVESIFSRNFTDKSVPDLIASLLDKSLIQRRSNEPGEVRYDMLVTIQQFALGCLQRVGDESKVRNAHLAYFLDLAERGDHKAHGPNQIEWMDRLNDELDNFRAALNWSFSSGQTEVCLKLFAALAWTWNVRWSQSEGRSWFYKIRAMPGTDEYPASYAQILNGAGLREWRQGNYGEARSVLEESLVLWQKLGAAGELGKAACLVSLGMVARWWDEDNNASESYFRQSLALFQRCEDEWGVAWNYFHLGIVATDRNQDEAALSFLGKSLDLYNELGDPWGEARVSQFLGMLYLKQGNYRQAYYYFDQHLRNDEKLRFMDGVSVALCNFGALYRRQGDYDQAEKYYEKSLMINREYGMKLDIGIILYHLGLLALHQNHYPQALRHFYDYFELARTTNPKTGARDLFIGLAAVAGGTNQPERAAKLFGAAQILFDDTDNLFSPFDRAELDRHIEIARDQLGNIRFENQKSEGRSMSLEAAIVFALEVQEYF